MTSVRVPFLTRLRVRDFKSIAECDIQLGAFNVLFGRNGAGKSNVLDAVRFVRDALSASPAEAAAARGGWDAVLRRVPTAAEACDIALEVRVSVPLPGLPAAALALGRYEVSFDRHGAVRERCEVMFPDGEAANAQFAAEDGTVYDPATGTPLGEVPPGALHLPLAAATTEPYTRLHAALTSTYFHAPALPVLPDTVLGTWERDRVSAYLNAIAPQPTAATARARALLAALYQPAARDGRIPLLALENPTASLHPLAAGVLHDALTEASAHVQILATSHSAELFDRKDADLDAILVCAAHHGVTTVGPLDHATRSAITGGLATVGDLLRSDQLAPPSPATTAP